MTGEMGIEEAIDIAIKAELNDNAFYNDAMSRVSNEQGKDLLRQLANFEMGHYNKLMELRSSLKESGEYVDYIGMEFAEVAVPSESGPETRLAVNRDDVIGILKLAINAELAAYERYSRLSAVTEDPKGKEMFRKLAGEEELHRRILSDQFFQISNNGAWVWGR